MKNNRLTHKSQKKYDFSLTHWLGAISIAIFFLISPYKKALFIGNSNGFELPIYHAMLYVFIIFLFIAIYLFRNWSISNVQGVLSIAVLMLPFIHITASFSSVAIHAAKFISIVYFFYAALFIAGLYLVHGRFSRIFFEWTIVLSAYIVVLFGLLNLFGQIYYPDAMWLAHDGYRLTSVFQYSNTYAGFLTALLLVTTYLVTTRKALIEVGIHAVMLVPILSSLFLAMSRGALVILPLLVVLILLLMNTSRQIMFILIMILAGVGTVIILEKLTALTSQIANIVQPVDDIKPATPISILNNLPLAGWGLLLVSSIIIALLILIAQRWMTPQLQIRLVHFEKRKYSSFLAPFALTISGIVGIIFLLTSSLVQGILPSNITDRITNINFQQHSVLERITFYSDALKVVQDYPIIGAGGGAWNSLYEQYQNNPYVSRQAHSYFVDTLVSVGWLGFLVIIGFIVVSYLIYLKLYVRYPQLRDNGMVFFILSFSLLVHSAIDFDMSFVYIGALVFFCLGAMLSNYKAPLTFGILNKYSGKPWRLSLPTLLVLLSLFLIALCIRETAAIREYRQAVTMAASGQPLSHLIPEIDQAIDLSPAQTEFSLVKIDWLIEAHRKSGEIKYNDDAREEILHAKQYTTHNRLLILSEYRNLKGFGEYNKALEVLEKGINKFQWDINFYEAAIMEYLLNGQRLKQTDLQSAQSNWTRGLELYREILNRMTMLKELPKEQLQGRDFSITPFSRQAIGQLFYEMRDFESARQVLEPMREADLRDPYNRIGVRYYLATLHVFGQTDESLQNLLIKADSHEKIALDGLITTK
jgi:O-antigen ligase/tetratricopeptide (TPR) repeat protein